MQMLGICILFCAILAKFNSALTQLQFVTSR